MNMSASDYAYRPVSFVDVSIEDGFWKPRIDTAVYVTIPYDFDKCESTGRIDNFAKAGGLMPGKHEGIYYDDSDVFKVVEGAAYALQVAPNPELDSYLDDLIDQFAAAQEADGYLYTARTIDPVNPPEPCGPERWSNLAVNHELYNVGHMYEAAAAHHEATGKRNFLDIALKNADLIESVFGVDKLRDVPGHQEIEIGLVRLFRVTGDERYLRLAKFFLDERGLANDREIYGPYCQDHEPVARQSEAVGHAVRAVYMYAGMTDIAALTGDSDYVKAVHRLWENVAGKKLSLTGGIGARHEGEAFGADYELPNLTAYNETCAAQASIFWNQRMFQLTGQAKFIDILERTLYNGFLSGVGMDGESFYYVNPLACDGEFRFNRETSMARQPWYKTACCPTNVVRLLPALSGYIYASRAEDLYVNLYIAGDARVKVGDSNIELRQRHNYPWDGRIELDVKTSAPREFTLRLRIPAFAQGYPLPGELYRYIEAEAAPVRLSVADEEHPVDLHDGYAVISRRWQGATKIALELPMAVRRALADSAVAELRGKVALERGPLVYALEAADNGAGLLDLGLKDSTVLASSPAPNLLGGVTVIQGEAQDAAGETRAFKALPYYAWGHRGAGEMTVWLNRL